jgi:hypothetical protein
MATASRGAASCRGASRWRCSRHSVARQTSSRCSSARRAAHWWGGRAPASTRTRRGSSSTTTPAPRTSATRSTSSTVALLAVREIGLELLQKRSISAPFFPICTFITTSLCHSRLHPVLPSYPSLSCVGAGGAWARHRGHLCSLVPCSVSFTLVSILHSSSTLVERVTGIFRCTNACAVERSRNWVRFAGACAC